MSYRSRHADDPISFVHICFDRDRDFPLLASLLYDAIKTIERLRKSDGLLFKEKLPLKATSRACANAADMTLLVASDLSSYR